ncbi:MAG TPA: gamma-glutamyltransferase [Chloroflexota bacterium]
MPDVSRHRPVVMGVNGMLATGHPLASLAGVRVLQDGGNAFDAIVAAAAVVAVTKPSMTGLGGHNLAVLWDAKRQELAALDANGPAPASATAEAYRDGIPDRGPLSASVPGTVAGWDALLSRFGTRKLADLLQPAIGYARHGFAVGHLLHQEIAEAREDLAEWPATAAVLLPGGRVPEPTELLLQPDLARSLELIAHDGPAAFYEGEIAQRIGESVTAAGGILAAPDFSGFKPRWGQPWRVGYRDVDFYGQPPPSQGFIIGQELNVFEAYDPRALSEAERLHIMVEAKKLAFADRSRYLCDPEFHPVPLDVLLSNEHAGRQRERIAPHAAAGVQALDLAVAGGETTYMCAVDGQGNAVSFIQSLFHNFGSCFVAEGTGILLSDRMCGFSIDPAHPNVVAPGKRPSMTLNTCMIFRDGRPWVVYGTPGADAQVQTNFQHAVDFVDFGMDVQTAIECPRYRHLPSNKLLLETRFAPETIDALRAKGHDVVLGGPWHKETGGAQAIMIDPHSGVLQGGADPRREGYAIGF